LPAACHFSPADRSRGGPHKYFLAEIYSGNDPATIAGKVVQLDTLCQFAVQRWNDRNSDRPAVADVTQIIGAAALIYSAGNSPRSTVLRNAIRIAHVGAMQTTHLQRLLLAGRFFVQVLDKNQCPSTYSQRMVADALGRQDALLQNQDALLQNQGALLQNVAATLSRVEARLAGIPE
jgi:hypothetical protein